MFIILKGKDLEMESTPPFFIMFYFFISKVLRCTDDKFIQLLSNLSQPVIGAPHPLFSDHNLLFWARCILTSYVNWVSNASQCTNLNIKRVKTNNFFLMNYTHLRRDLSNNCILERPGEVFRKSCLRIMLDTSFPRLGDQIRTGNCLEISAGILGNQWINTNVSRLPKLSLAVDCFLTGLFVFLALECSFGCLNCVSDHGLFHGNLDCIFGHELFRACLSWVTSRRIFRGWPWTTPLPPPQHSLCTGRSPSLYMAENCCVSSRRLCRDR